MTIGEKIRLLRELKRLTQSEVADLANIPQATYSRLEKKGDKVSVEHLSQIATVLECSVSDIILFGETQPPTPKETDLIKQIDLLNTENLLLKREISILEREKQLLTKVIENPQPQ